MTTEAALKRIQEQQLPSGLSAEDYYTALAVISRMDGILRAALKLAPLAPKYDIGKPDPIPEVKLMEQLHEDKR